MPAYAAGDERAGMFLEMDYYADPDRGAVPQWRNEMSEMTWAHWLTFDGLSPAARVATPSLFVHSDGCVLPDNVRAVAAAMTGPTELAWGSGEQTDYYDRPDQTSYALDAVDRHLRATIGAPA